MECHRFTRNKTVFATSNTIPRKIPACPVTSFGITSGNINSPVSHTMLAFLPRATSPILCPPSRFPRLLCSLPTPNAASSHLYLVSTPIGNPLDLTIRAASILRTVSVIAAEDTRRTGLLLSTHSLRSSQTLISFHRHNFRARLPGLLNRLRDGQSVALVSDAGTPCVSDPGVEFVKEAVAQGIQIVPVPGASAVLAAWVGSGMGGSDFWFAGFLPRSGKERKYSVEKMQKWQGGIVLYEAPHRLRDTLQDLREEKREVCVAREVTKKWEEFVRFDNLEEASRHYESVEPRGEFTIVLGPKSEALGNDSLESALVDVRKLVTEMIQEGVAVSVVARCVARTARVPKKLVYAFAEEVKRQQELQGDGKCA